MRLIAGQLPGEGDEEGEEEQEEDGVVYLSPEENEAIGRL
jgi:hypothetical protein